jgi:hypothetical protein
MSLVTTIVVAIVVVLVILGIYFIVQRSMDFNKMVDQAKAKIPQVALCEDSSKKGAAASCYISRMIHEYGFDRVRDLFLGSASISVEEGLYIVTITGDCQGKCKKS